MGNWSWRADDRITFVVQTFGVETRLATPGTRLDMPKCESQVSVLHPSKFPGGGRWRQDVSRKEA